jgi:hypothetical protein
MSPGAVGRPRTIDAGRGVGDFGRRSHAADETEASSSKRTQKGANLFLRTGDSTSAGPHPIRETAAAFAV